MTARATPPGLRMAIDYGPLLAFFLVNMFAPGLALAKLLAATVAFMLASIVAMTASWVKSGRISPMLWIAGALVLVFGGLTLWFHDGTFIKMKPTFVYAMFSAVLAYGLATNKPLLQQLLDSAYPGLSAQGWRKLTRNWAIFFAFMAVLNEIVWRWTAPLPNSDLTFWAGFKLWGAVPLTLLFALANVPMLLKHGLTLGENEAAAEQLPPE